MIKLIKIIFIPGILLLIFNACEENPLDESTITPESRQITGAVQLVNQPEHSGIYIWLEGFNLGTYTDGAGEFQLTLPSTEVSGSTGSINGVFHLYFYIANYAIATAEIVVQDGLYLPSHADLDADGRLNGVRTLLKILNIRTTVEPDSIIINQQATVVVKVFLQAVHDTVEVSLPKLIDVTGGPLILQDIHSEQTYINDMDAGDTGRSIEAIGPDVREWDLAFVVEPEILPEGEYEVIPYFLILQEGIPDRLIRTLGPRAHELGPEFVRIPYRRDGGEFWIIGAY